MIVSFGACVRCIERSELGLLPELGPQNYWMKEHLVEPSFDGNIKPDFSSFGVLLQSFPADVPRSAVQEKSSTRIPAITWLQERVQQARRAFFAQ
eukprot:2483514-Pyramimonas_sp.AAC.1